MPATLARPSSAEDAEHLVPLPLHQPRIERLEVEAEKGLGVRRAEVQVPVLGGDLQPVDVRDPPFASEPLLHLLELQRDVVDAGVQLAGDEVALPVRAEQL